MLVNSSSPENRLEPDKQTFNLESSVDDSKLDLEDSPTPLLPRSAWNSNLAFLRVVFKAKKALDEIEFTENKK